MTPFVVPAVEDMAALDDDALGALCARLLAAAADCEANALGARDVGNDAGADRIDAAKRHYLRGARTAKALMAQRKGERYTKPRPVVNFPTAVIAVKSTMRMMGLLDEFFRCFQAWHLLDDDADDTAEWAELMRAYDDVADAEAVAA